MLLKLHMAATAYDWSTLDFTDVTENFYAVVPAAVAVVIGFIAFRKAYGFILGQIKRA